MPLESGMSMHALCYRRLLHDQERSEQANILNHVTHDATPLLMVRDNHTT